MVSVHPFGAGALLLVMLASSCSLDDRGGGTADGSGASPSAEGGLSDAGWAAAGGAAGAGASGGAVASAGAPSMGGSGGSAGAVPTGGAGGSAGTSGSGGVAGSGGTGGSPALDCGMYPNNAQAFTVQDQTHCYWLGGGTMSWTGARDACASSGGYLVTIHTQDENTFVRGLSTGEFWLGLGQASSGSCAKSTFSWVTQEPASDFWGNGEPNCAQGSVQAGRMTNSAWGDQPQSMQLAFVCEVGPHYE